MKMSKEEREVLQKIGSRAGKKGAAMKTKEERSALASRAAKARWDKLRTKNAEAAS